MTITAANHGREVIMEYGPELADIVNRIDNATGEDGVLQAADAVEIFPGNPTLHTTMTFYRALLAAGCVEAE